MFKNQDNKQYVQSRRQNLLFKGENGEIFYFNKPTEYLYVNILTFKEDLEDLDQSGTTNTSSKSKKHVRYSWRL